MVMLVVGLCLQVGHTMANLNSTWETLSNTVFIALIVFAICVSFIFGVGTYIEKDRYQ